MTIDSPNALPFASVVVPHLNDHDRLVHCLRHLHEQTYPQNRYEIIVVDNGSARPIDDIVKRFPRARAMIEMEKGCGTARNRGVLEARGKILAFTDSDCRPDPHWLEKGVTRLVETGAEIAGGEIKVFAADERRPTDEELFDKVFGFEQKRYVTWKRFAAGANIFTTREAFDRIGPFLNGRHPEDLEWGNRAVAKGCRIAYAPDAIIRHPARRTWAEIRAKVDRTVFHSRNYQKERRLFQARWLILTAAVASPPLVKFLILARTPELNGWTQRIRAARMLIKVRAYRVGRMTEALIERAGPSRDKLA
jgi:GT2 family glycosyltransferase